MPRLNGLSLAGGVAVAKALARFGLSSVALKWPNDIFHEEQKLGGILVEVFGQTAGPVSVVIGIGLNVEMPPAVGRHIDQAWTDLYRAMGSAGRARNRLAGVVLDELASCVQMFEKEGWPAFQAQWRDYDIYHGRQIDIHTTDGVEQGVYLGVDADGGLILGQGQKRKIFHAGDVSLRHASEREKA
jgi:BirA family biotin operon repressor/biotin-[acetyl-CoA-carboxylase] ligase